MKNYFIKMFEYDKWANRKIISALLEIDNPPGKTVSLCSHLGTTLDIWLGRITDTGVQSKSFFDEKSLSESRTFINDADERWIKFLSSLNDDDLDKVVKYKNMKGNDYEDKMINILTQLITHSHYHRGQINILLRENGFEPVVTDYIFYLRDK